MNGWLMSNITADEERAIAAFMHRLATVPAPDTAMRTSQNAIWWKGQLLRRWDEQRWATRPVAVMEPIQLAAGLAAAALVLVWTLPSLTRVLLHVAERVMPLV